MTDIKEIEKQMNHLEEMKKFLEIKVELKRYTHRWKDDHGETYNLYTFSIAGSDWFSAVVTDDWDGRKQLLKKLLAFVGSHYLLPYEEAKEVWGDRLWDLIRKTEYISGKKQPLLWDTDEEPTPEMIESYDEMLDECCPEIKIGNLTYRPSLALKEMDPITYRAGLFEHIDFEKQEALYEQEQEKKQKAGGN